MTHVKYFFKSLVLCELGKQLFIIFFSRAKYELIDNFNMVILTNMGFIQYGVCFCWINFNRLGNVLLDDILPTH